MGHRDLTGGFKCFIRKALEKIDLTRITVVGYGFQIETTWRARLVGLMTQLCGYKIVLRYMQQALYLAHQMQFVII